MHDCRLHGGRNILFIAIRAVGEDEIDLHPGHGLRRGQRIVGPHRQEHGSQSVGLGAGRSRDRHRQQARNGAAPRAGVDRVGDLVAFGIEVETAVIARGGQAAFGHPDTPLEVFAVRHVAVDALGRRTAKQYFGKITRWVWDGNVPIHEWSYKAIGLQSDEAGILPKEPVEDITTWVFEAGTFVPTAKIQESKQYSIVSDYLGTPIQMYDGQGNKTWDCTLDIYGKVIAVDKGTEFDCPFRFQGQYADEETGLFYNRFRYYSLNINSYINQDFIRIYGGYHIYNYVHDTNKYIDIFGLSRKKYSYLIGANGTILGENISQDTDINSLNHQFKEIVIKAKSEVTNPKPYHGKCAEINAIQKALDNGYSLDDIKGATMRTVKMFEGKSTNELVPACECCKIVMKELGIKEEYGKIEECH